MVATTWQSGSGGGAGGGAVWQSGHLCSAGGGGGGGGALRLAAIESIDIAGRVSALGGNGGQGYVISIDGLRCAGGGGGSGGLVYLIAPQVSIAGTIDTSGGLGGSACTTVPGMDNLEAAMAASAASVFRSCPSDASSEPDSSLPLSTAATPPRWLSIRTSGSTRTRGRDHILRREAAGDHLPADPLRVRERWKPTDSSMKPPSMATSSEERPFLNELPRSLDRLQDSP